MARPKKDGHFITCYIRSRLWNAVNRYSDETGLPKTAIIEKALEEYFKSHGCIDVKSNVTGGLL